MPAPGWSPGVPRHITGPQHGGALGDAARGQSGMVGGARRAPTQWRTQPGEGSSGGSGPASWARQQATYWATRRATRETGKGFGPQSE
jgi:hypothetical protein